MEAISLLYNGEEDMGFFKKNDIQQKFAKVNFYFEQRRFEEAVKLLDDILSVDPENDTILFIFI